MEIYKNITVIKLYQKMDSRAASKDRKSRNRNKIKAINTNRKSNSVLQVK